MRESIPCSASASGVVCLAGRTMSSISLWMVPMSPTRAPVVSRMCLTMQVTVVLPLVPVTPMRRSRRAGLPYQLPQSRP